MDNNRGLKMLKQGAEAKIYTAEYTEKAIIVKERFKKKYRHPALDRMLTSQRIKSEARSMTRCRINGIKTPAIYLVDMEENTIHMEHVQDSVTVRDHICAVYADTGITDPIQALAPLAAKIGQILGRMHDKNIIHGDLTTSNMLLRRPVAALDVVLIDFGLSHVESVAEDKGVDLYVLERALLSTHPGTQRLFTALLHSYQQHGGHGAPAVINKLNEIRLRGRKRTMVG